MAAFWIPCGGDSDITHRVVLEGVTYDFRYRYLQRITNVASEAPIKADEWVLSIALSGQDPIIQTSLKTNRDLLRPYRSREGCPSGTLQLRDITADESLSNGGDYSPERVSYDTLGIDKRFRVLYITSDGVI